ncbi:hypothetical protein MMC26_004065 [Xylographa opegraphella]|nr:hypothetical protein [Xylographa opegraphella]
MSTRDKVPDAWDDDWVNKADKSVEGAVSEIPGSEIKLSKAARRAKQAALNKKIWEEAETPNNPYFVETRNDVPLKTEFKPAVKVLSRKPAPNFIARTDPVSGLEQLTIEDDDDDDDDEGKQKTLTMEERQLKAQKEREEKQKKYEEVRERLFGASESSSAVNSTGAVTPPTARATGDRSRGKNKPSREPRPSSSNSGKSRQLFDPNYNAKPDSIYVQKKEGHLSGSRPLPRAEEPILRTPKGPDGSGRGGFGFAMRGNKAQ